MFNQNLKEYINNYEILSHISSSDFIITILKNFNPHVKITHIFNKNYELMLDIDYLNIYIKNYYDKEEIINKIRNILLYSKTIINYYNPYGRRSEQRIYLTQHIKQYQYMELKNNHNNFIITYDLLRDDRNFNKYRDFMEFVLEETEYDSDFEAESDSNDDNLESGNRDWLLGGLLTPN